MYQKVKSNENIKGHSAIKRELDDNFNKWTDKRKVAKNGDNNERISHFRSLNYEKTENKTSHYDILNKITSM